MSVDEKDPPVQIIDGEAMYVPDLDAWESFLQSGVFQRRRIFPEDMKDLVEVYLALAQRHSEFSLAFHSLPFSESWLICMLLRTASGTQRVHIEHLKCKVCGWYGPTANPMVSDLYLGATDKFEAMRNAERHPLVPCPKCGSELPRHPIWAKPGAESNESVSG